METKIIIIVLLLINIVTSETALCLNNITAVYECCQDYKNNSGNCEECIGSWGKNCGNNCSNGYYGHGCRKRCNCIYQQICDPMEGCVEGYHSAECTNNKIGEKCQNYTDGFANGKDSSDSNVNQTVASLLAVSGLLILLFLGTVFYCNRILKKQSKPFQRSKEHEVNTSEIQDGQEDFIYNDIRESRMVDNGCALSGVYNLPQFCELTSSMKKDRVMNNQTRFKTVCPEEYGRWYRGSDNYNHINFNIAKQLSSYSDVMTSDYMYDITTSHETQVNDDECGNIQLKKETIKIRHGSVMIHQNRKLSSMANRPYSSVKYNRNMRKNEEH